MQVGDVYYRRIDNCGCEIKGFFYLHYDGTMSTVVDNYKLLRTSVIKHDLVPDNIHVLFHNDTFDTVENLYTSLYMLPYEYKNWKQVYREILDEQESYEGQPYWREEDLVPSKIETRKKFKLW